MAMSTRRLNRQHIREEDDDSDDDFKDNPRSIFGGNHNTAANQTPQPLRQSYFILDALSNPTSSLARFLFVGGDSSNNDNDNQDGHRRLSWFQSKEDDDKSMQSLHDINSLWYALSLEPMKIRNERIIMLFEAYTIFGTLFFNAVWIIYEWGSYKGYGGDHDSSSVVVGRLFECLMSIALGCNMILTLFGAWFWISAVNFSSSNPDYVFNNKEALSFIHMVYCFTVNFIMIGFLIGFYCNLSPHIPDTVAAICFTLILWIMGLKVSRVQLLAVGSLEWYHMPRIIQTIFPIVVGHKAKEKLKVDAKKRAMHLRQRAFCERKKLDPDFIETKHYMKDHDADSIGGILRAAAVNLGRIDSDTSIYEARLEAEWLCMETLRGRSVDYLSRYMPTVLAEEVHRLIETKKY